MKIGTFDINTYLNKLYENVEEKDLKVDKSAGTLSDNEGIIIPDGNKKAYDWLKKEYQKGKTEVKVEMSSHEFKPNMNIAVDDKSTKDFKPGMYGNIKTSDTEKGGKKDTAVPFPETKFPGSSDSPKKEETTEKKNESDKPEEKSDAKPFEKKEEKKDDKENKTVKKVEIK